MKLLTYSTCFLLVLTIQAWGQQVPMPTIPNNVAFAGMSLQLNADARAIVQSDIKALFTNKKYWEAKLDRCVQYFPLIEGVLIDENVPNDFKYLAVQESSLQPDAISSSNAVGFWQFKKETAIDYGLRVDDQIDERKHIIASTHAAAQYLKKSNTQFNNWLASLYSYYLGAGTIAKTIPTDWSYARELPLDGKTDRYILRFLAHKIAIESTIERYQSPTPVALLEYPNAGGRNIETVAKDLNIDLTALRAQNRWLSTNDIPSDKAYSLIIPTRTDQMEGMKELLAAKAPVGNKRDNFAQTDIGFPVLNRAQAYSNNLLLYEINGLPGIMAANGDDAAALAKKSKISFSSFLRYNDMSEQMDIEPGQVYYLAKKSKRAAVPYHTVREGETLWKVSQIYGLRLKNLIRYNRIGNRNTRLQTGRVLWLTKKRPRNQPVEVIDVPQDEWRPGQKSQPRPAVTETTNNDKRLPQTPAERKVYTPKMADKTGANLEESADDGVEITQGTNGKTTSKPAPSTKPNRRAPSFNPSDDEKVVIIGEDAPAKSPSKTKSTSQEPSTPKNNSKVVDNQPKNVPASVQEPPVASKPAAKTGAITHVVEAGQTYFSISKMYDVTVNDILYWNNLTADSKLAVGQKLNIRPVGQTLAQQPKAEEFTTHTVAQGETMFSISQKYGVKIDQIKEWNNLTDNGVKIGQQLKIKKQ